MKRFLMFFLAAIAAAPASAATITFAEIAYVGPLTDQYASFGITFGLSGTISTARAYSDARDTFDGRGVVGTPERGNPNIIFNSVVNDLSFDYSSLGKSFFIRAFDVDDADLELLLINVPTGVTTNASATFSAVGIKRIQLLDIDQQVGISTLRFTAADAAAVPEPANWAMMISGFGLTGAALRRRSRSSRGGGAHRAITLHL